jgi:hypothetical protein
MYRSSPPEYLTGKCGVYVDTTSGGTPNQIKKIRMAVVFRCCRTLGYVVAFLLLQHSPSNFVRSVGWKATNSTSVKKKQADGVVVYVSSINQDLRCEDGQVEFSRIRKGSGVVAAGA